MEPASIGGHNSCNVAAIYRLRHGCSGRGFVTYMDKQLGYDTYKRVHMNKQPLIVTICTQFTPRFHLPFFELP